MNFDKLNEILYNEEGGDCVSNAQKIRMALGYVHMSESDLARKFGSSPQAFSQRMKTDKFKADELVRIADILGASYLSSFEFPDGTKI